MARCPRCGGRNASGNRFCVHCGVPLEVLQPSFTPPPGRPAAAGFPAREEEVPVRKFTKCARCGRENPEGSRFCVNCGTPLEAPQPGFPSMPAEPMAPRLAAPRASPPFPRSPAPLWTGKQVATEAIRAVRAS